MYPYIVIAGHEFASFSLFLRLGFLLPLLLAYSMRPEDFCLTRLQIAVAGLLFFTFGMIGAKLLSITLWLREYTPYIIEGSLGRLYKDIGGASPGIHIYGFVALYIFAKAIKKPFLELADYGEQFLMLSLAIVRVGCLMAGCCYGSPSSLPWATVFSRWGGMVARHPTQAYEMIYLLSISITAFRFYPHLKKIAGATFFLAHFSFFFMRFFNEFLRVDSPSIIWVLKLSHLWMMTVMLLCAIGFYCSVCKKGRKQELLALVPRMAQMLLLCLVIIGFIALSLLTVF